MASAALLAGAVAPVVASVVSPTPALAANLVVTSTADSGAGSLRLAVANANVLGGDVITFAWGISPVVLTSGPIVIDKDLTIRGNGSANTTITRNAQFPSFGIIEIADDVTATIDMVTISGGSAAAGAGIMNDGTLTLARSTVSGNVGIPGAGGGGTAGVGVYNNFNDTVTITNSQITGNTATNPVESVFGGGVSNQGGGRMTIANSLIANNSISGLGVFGGGIQDEGFTLTINDTLISGNTATSTDPGFDALGGGIDHRVGTLTLTNSIVRGNTATGPLAPTTGVAHGGGLHLAAATTIERAEISGNTATGGVEQEGGGVYLAGGITASITNSTIANNTAASDGGGLYSGSAPAVTLVNATVAGNLSSGAAIDSDASNVSLRNTIVNNPASGSNCSGTIADFGNNLVFGGTVGTCPGTNADPKLQALGDNGGVSQTMALGAGSAAIDGGANCPTVDQRNYMRVGTCDIGAYDAAGALPDAAPPVCKMTGILAENTKKQNVTATDAGRGLQSITPVTNTNAYIVIPYFLPRTNLTVTMTAVKINQSATSVWRFNATDQAGNVLLCQ